MDLNELIVQIENDLSYVKDSRSSFAGTLVKSHLEALLRYQPDSIEGKIARILALYEHDGHQCFLDSDRPLIAQLLEEILDGLKEVQI